MHDATARTPQADAVSAAVDALARSASCPSPQKAGGLLRRVVVRGLADVKSQPPSAAPTPAAKRFPKTPASGGAGQKTSLHDKRAYWELQRTWLGYVANDLEILQLAPAKLKEDRGWLLKVVKTHPDAYKHLPKDIRSDVGWLTEVLQAWDGGWQLLRDAPDELRSNKAIFLAAAQGSKQGWRALQWASGQLRSDESLIREVSRFSGAAREYATLEVRAMTEVCVSALSVQHDMEDPDHEKKQIAQRRMKQRQWHCGSLTGLSSQRRPSNSTFRRVSHFSAASRRSSRRSMYSDGEESGSPPRRASMAASATGLKEPSGTWRNGTWSTQRSDHPGLVAATARGVPPRDRRVAEMKLQKTDGLVFVQVAEVRADGKLQPGCLLPFAVYTKEEAPRKVLMAAMKEQLGPLFKGICVLEEPEKPPETTDPKEVARKACFTMFPADLEKGFEWAKHVAAVPVAGGHDVRPRASFRPHSGVARRFSVEGSLHSRPDFYWLADRDRQRIYAWLPPWELAWFNGSEMGRSTLAAWLQQLKVGGPAERGPRGPARPPTR